MSTPISTPDELQDVLSQLPEVDETLPNYLMPIRTLVGSLWNNGVRLTPTDDDDAPLYIWHCPRGTAIYVGKASGKNRHDEEARWVAEQTGTELSLADGSFSLLMKHTGASSIRFSYEVDWEPVLEAAVLWGSDIFEKELRELASKGQPPAELIERTMIRTIVRSGRFTANSQYAGVWASKKRHVSEVLAIDGIVAGREGGYIAPFKSDTTARPTQV